MKVQEFKIFEKGVFTEDILSGEVAFIFNCYWKGQGEKRVFEGTLMVAPTYPVAFLNGILLLAPDLGIEVNEVKEFPSRAYVTALVNDLLDPKIRASGKVDILRSNFSLFDKIVDEYVGGDHAV